MRLTRTGWGVLAAGTGLLLAGLLLGLPVLRLLAGAVVGALALGAVQARRAPRLEVRRDVYPEQVPRGDAAVARLSVRNVGGRRSYPFEANDPTGHEVVEVRVDALDPGQSTTRTYRLPTSRRGVIPVGPLTLTREDGLGLFRAEVATGSTAVLRVHPRTHVMLAVATGRQRQYDGRQADASLRGSQVFHALREYVVGDEIRYVHWKSSARTGQLMVREHIDPHRPQLTVLLDTRQARYDGGAGEPFEEAVDLAASLLRSATDRANPVRLLTTAGLSLGNELRRQDLGPLLDQLCGVQATQGIQGSWTSVLNRESVGGSLAIVTARVDVTGMAEAARLRRQYGAVTVFDLLDGASAGPGVLLVREPTAAAAAATWNARSSR